MFQAFGRQQPAGTPITAALEKWRAHNLRYTPRTRQHYAMVIGKFRQSLPVTTIEELRPSHIEGYLNHLLAKGVKNRTINAHLTALKSASGWLARNYGIPNIGVGFSMLPEDPPKQRVLTPEEYQKVLAICSDSEADMIKFLAHTGLRATEAVTLTWGNIDPALTKIILVGKGRRRRTVPLNRTCQEILKKYPRGTPETHIDFLKSKRRHLNYICNKLAIKSKIRRFGPHSLRHYFCTQMLRCGVPMVKVSQILGHSSVRTTERIYLHLQESDLLNVTDCLD